MVFEQYSDNIRRSYNQNRAVLILLNTARFYNYTGLL